MSNIDFQNGFAIGVASKGQAQSVAQNPLEYATTLRETYIRANFLVDEISLNVPNIVSLQDAFMFATGLKKITLKGNVAENTMTFANTFRQITTLEEIDLTDFICKPTNISYLFYNNKALKTVSGEFDLTSVTAPQAPFTNCTALEEIRFKANTIYLSLSFANSSLLSAESVQSIIDGLATVETAQTLTLNSAITVSDTQKATIEAKGWTLVQ